MVCRIFDYNTNTRIARVMPANYIRNKEGLLESSFGEQFLQNAYCHRPVTIGMDYPGFKPVDKTINNQWCRYEY